MPTTPQQYNTFIPDTDATNQMIIDFSRNVQDFALPNYALYVPVKKNVGIYTEMTIEQAGRLPDPDGADLLWADGDDAPSHANQLEEFAFRAYQTQRYAPGFRMGELAAEQASWEVVAQHSRITSQRAMTLRTSRSVRVATNTANYPTGHASSVLAIPGVSGRWDESTTARTDIKRSLDWGARQVQIATLSAVKPSEMMVVCNPDTAAAMALSQEMRDQIKGSPDSLRSVTEGIGDRNRYGLPETVHDYKFVIEDAVKVTTRKGETTNKEWVWPDGVALMCSRPGGLEGIEGAPTFSTLSLFLKEEMTVETKHDRDARAHKGRVVDDFVLKVTAGISGYLFTDVVNTA